MPSSQILSVTRQKLWYKNIKGKRGKLMSVAQRERFDAQLIMCSEYEGLTPQDEREIFQASLSFFLHVAALFEQSPTAGPNGRPPVSGW